MSQAERLFIYLTTHPGASSLEITLAIGCVNVTGRVSDLRKAGHVVDAWRASDKVWRYRIIEQPVQLEAFG